MLPAADPPPPQPATNPPGQPQPWLTSLRRVVASGSGFESQRYLAKWLLLGTLIGVVAGVGAILFSWAIEVCTHFFLGTLVGYLPPSPIGEGNQPVTAMLRPWLLPLVVALGGLLSGLLVFSLAPEAKGHGTDSAIAAIHHGRARIRGRIPPVKLVASAITIGSGGSAGREGPTAQISAGFGSLLAQWLRLSVGDRRIAVAAGIGAGIGAIFRAPLGGAVMAAEILYIHDLEVEALIPSLIASIVGFSIFGLVNGFTPIFGEQPQLGFSHPIELLYFAALGVLAGLVGLLYAKVFYGTERVFDHLRLPRWLKPALGGLLVGLMGVFIPQTIHTGYGWVQFAMTPQLLTWPLWLLLLLPFLRILATSLTIGSGGSGGIFGPGMVIGGLLGAAFWRVGHTFLPQMPPSPAPYVIIGMMATFGGIAHAPLAMMLMVAEMTGNLALLAPAMVAVAIATALVGDNTIYQSQLPDRASSPAHRVRFSFPLLSTLRVQDAMQEAPPPAIQADASLSEAEAMLEDGTGLVVVNARGEALGALTREALRAVPPGRWGNLRAGQLVGEYPVLLEAEQAMDTALDRLLGRGLGWAPVVEGGRVVGCLHVRDVMAVYKASLARSVQRAAALPEDTALFEAQVTADSPLVGHSLADAGLPRGALVVSITRGGHTIFPRADTCLQVGDQVLLMADPESEGALRAFLAPAAEA